MSDNSDNELSNAINQDIDSNILDKDEEFHSIIENLAEPEDQVVTEPTEEIQEDELDSKQEQSEDAGEAAGEDEPEPEVEPEEEPEQDDGDLVLDQPTEQTEDAEPDVSEQKQEQEENLVEEADDNATADVEEPEVEPQAEVKADVPAPSEDSETPGLAEAPTLTDSNGKIASDNESDAPTDIEFNTDKVPATGDSSDSDMQLDIPNIPNDESEKLDLQDNMEFEAPSNQPSNSEDLDDFKDLEGIAQFKDDNDDVYKPSSDVEMNDIEKLDVDNDTNDYNLDELKTSPEPEHPEEPEVVDQQSTASPSEPTEPEPKPAPTETTTESETQVKQEDEPQPHVEEPEEEVDEEEIIRKQNKRIRQTHTIIIPSYASWFNMKKIHQIERESLPEFFNTNHPSKSPKIYANYRNFMINSYRLNPNEYLTLTSCRRNLVGDVGTLMRVHRFLNKWGLINYQVNPQLKPGYAVEKLPNGSAVGLPYTGDYHVQYDTPRGLFPFDTYKPSSDRIDVNKLKQLVGHNPASTTTTSDSISDIKESGQPPAKKQKIEENTNDGWSSAEVNKLAIAIKKYQNDWYKISKSLDNRTPQECILKFLKLPIEDRFDDLSDEKDTKILRYASNFPVSSVDNPVISNLTFMTQLVESEVAKAASKRASDKVDEIIVSNVKSIYGDGKPEAPKKQEVKEEPKEDTKATDEEKQNSPIEGAVEKESEPTKTANGDMEVVEEEKETDQNGSVDSQTSSEDVLHDAAANTFGIVGGRSHLFANYEEREMNRLTSTIVNHQLSKLNVKLNKVSELEKVYERERRQLAQQQHKIFFDRLSLTKSTINITKKLNNAVNIIQSSKDSKDPEGLSNVTKILLEVQSLIYEPLSSSLVSEDESTNTAPNAESNDEATQNGTTESKSQVPFSVEAPQAFKVWAP